MNKKISFLLNGLIALSLVLAMPACSARPEVQPVSSPVVVETVLAPTMTLSLSPTTANTPTPQPKKVVLVAPMGGEGQPVQALSELSAGSQMVLETRENLQAGDLTADMAVVVWLTPPSNLSELAAAAPQTVFVAVVAVDQQPAVNVSVIRMYPEYQVFVGGFIAALLSPNWRAAGLLPSDGVLGERLQDAFVNGGRYFCGVCTTGWPLGEYYPQAGVLPGSSDGPAWQGQAAALFDNKKVDVYYLSAESARNEVYLYLAGKDQYGTPVRVVGAITPPGVLEGQWGATVDFDLAQALQQIWPDAAAGKGGASIDAPLTLTHVNPENLGEGKLRLVEDLIQDIAAGRIYPYSVPVE